VSECAEGKRLRERHDAEAAIVRELTGMAAGRHMQSVVKFHEKLMDHWTWCCECQGLVEVVHPPTGAKEGKC